MDYKIQVASYEADHKDILKVSRTSPFTRPLADVRYVQNHYANGGMAKALVRVGESWVLAGYILAYHCKVKPWTAIYYTTVLPQYRGHGLGSRLLEWVETNSPHSELRLGVAEENTEAIKFWTSAGFVPSDPSHTLDKRGNRILQLIRLRETSMKGRDNADTSLSVYEFGRRLLETRDLDPVYVVLYEAALDGETLRRWLLAYWCFYDMGTASWIADNQKEYWPRMESAAAGSWARGRERRHFRGESALSSVQWLKSVGLSHLLKPLESCTTVHQVVAAVKSWKQFGPWIAFKVADMLDSLGLVRLKVCRLSNLVYSSPAAGANDLWIERWPNDPAPENVVDWALRRLAIDYENDGFRSPPSYSRFVGQMEAETILCKYHAYLSGHYLVGEDTEACLKSLKKCLHHDGLRRFPKCQLSVRLLEAGEKASLW